MAIELSTFQDNKNYEENYIYGQPYSFNDIFYSIKLKRKNVVIVKVGCIVGLFVDNREYCLYFKLPLGSRAYALSHSGRIVLAPSPKKNCVLRQTT